MGLNPKKKAPLTQEPPLESHQQQGKELPECERMADEMGLCLSFVVALEWHLVGRQNFVLRGKGLVVSVAGLLCGPLLQLHEEGPAELGPQEIV